MSELTQSPAWKALAAHRETTKEVSIRAHFDADPSRFENFSRTLPGALFDFSKHRVNQQTLDLLIGLAQQEKVPEHIERMFAGDKINFTERRAVLHTALRNRSGRALMVDGQDLMPGIVRVLAKMPSHSPRREIDFILHSKQLQAKNFQVPAVTYSDHNPLVCDFHLSE